MADMLEYLAWRGDILFSQLGVNEVDALIFAELSFLDFTAIVPPPELGQGVRIRDAAAAFFARREGQEIDMGVLVPDAIPDLLCRMGGSVRYGDMVLNCFEALADLSIEQ